MNDNLHITILNRPKCPHTPYVLSSTEQQWFYLGRFIWNVSGFRGYHLWPRYSILHVPSMCWWDLKGQFTWTAVISRQFNRNSLQSILRYLPKSRFNQRRHSIMVQFFICRFSPRKGKTSDKTYGGHASTILSDCWCILCISWFTWAWSTFSSRENGQCCLILPIDSTKQVLKRLIISRKPNLHFLVPGVLEILVIEKNGLWFNITVDIMEYMLNYNTKYIFVTHHNKTRVISLR
jgi:hypothetical protein